MTRRGERSHKAARIDEQDDEPMMAQDAMRGVDLPNSGNPSSSSDVNFISKLIAHIVAGHDITEVYSSERVTAAAKEMGLSRGTAMDITTVDENGGAWDFTRPHMRRKAAEYIIR